MDELPLWMYLFGFPTLLIATTWLISTVVEAVRELANARRERDEARDEICLSADYENPEREAERRGWRKR